MLVTQINKPRAASGMGLVVLGLSGLVAAYKDYRAGAVPPAPEYNPEDAEEVETATDAQEESRFAPPLDEVTIEPELIKPVIIETVENEVVVAKEIPDSVLDAMTLPNVTTPPVIPIIPEVMPPVDVSPVPGKSMDPALIPQMQRIGDLLRARAKTKNWDITFPTVKQNGVQWKTIGFDYPALLTGTFVLFRRTGEALAMGKHNLLLDMTCSNKSMIKLREEKILKTIRRPTEFSETSTPIFVAGTGQKKLKHTLKYDLVKNRAYVLIPASLVMDDQTLQVDLSLTIVTTNGTPLPDITRILDMSFTMAEAVFVAARATNLITLTTDD